MVRRKRSHIRAGGHFLDFTRMLKSELEPIHKRRISDREITDGIADFLNRENLKPIILRKAKRKRGGLF